MKTLCDTQKTVLRKTIFPEDTPCCSQKYPECFFDGVCGPNERMIRRIIVGDHTSPLTAEQREWLIEEADRAGEGSYPREDAESLSDVELARWTMSAWQAYVRNNCL